RYQIPIIPGVFMPKDVLTATEFGYHVVKVFPVGRLGPRYFKELKEPLFHIYMILFDGVIYDNAAAFLQAGSFALGMGSYLVNEQLVKDKQFSEITRRAELLVQIVADNHS